MATLPRTPFDPDLPQYLAIEIEGRENHPPLQEVSNFIYDLNLVYEIARVATDPQYERYQFSRYIWNRKGRHLKDVDRLHVTSLRLGSPLVLETGIMLVATAIGGVWGLVQAAERIADWKPNREIKKLELEKLRSEVYPPTEPEEMPRRLSERGALQYYERTVERLSENKIKITDVRLRLESRPPEER